MRSLLVLCLLASSAWGGTDRGLSAETVQRYAAPYLPAIRACYLQHGRMRGATGELRVTVVLNRAGEIHELAVEAPGVTGKHLRNLDACVRREAEGWHFPVARVFTTAVLPFLFLALDLPSAGPQPSCWSSQGCRPRAHD